MLGPIFSVKLGQVPGFSRGSEYPVTLAQRSIRTERLRRRHHKIDGQSPFAHHTARQKDQRCQNDGD